MEYRFSILQRLSCVVGDVSHGFRNIPRTYGTAGNYWDGRHLEKEKKKKKDRKIRLTYKAVILLDY